MGLVKAVTIKRTLACLALLGAIGCKTPPSDAKSEVPPAATVSPDADVNLVHVEKPADFPLFAASSYQAPSKLEVTGSVNPDISRTIPVISIASGRVVD